MNFLTNLSILTLIFAFSLKGWSDVDLQQALPSRFIAEMGLDKTTVREDPREKLKAEKPLIFCPPMVRKGNEFSPLMRPSPFGIRRAEPKCVEVV